MFNFNIYSTIFAFKIYRFAPTSFLQEVFLPRRAGRHWKAVWLNFPMALQTRLGKWLIYKLLEVEEKRIAREVGYLTVKVRGERMPSLSH